MSITISSGRVGITFDDGTGCVRAVRGADLEVVGQGSLYVLEVPTPGDRTRQVATERQRLSGAQLDEDGLGLTLHWGDLCDDRDEHIPGRVTARARLATDRITLSLEAEVPGRDIEAVHFPSLRGIRPSDDETLSFLGQNYSQGSRVELLPQFHSTAPYWGTTYPDHASSNLRPEVLGNPTSPLVSLQVASSGWTLTPAEQTLDVIEWRVSLEPGYVDSMSRTTVSADPLIRGSVTLAAIHFPVGDRHKISVAPMSLLPYEGTEQAALEGYHTITGPTRRPPAPWLRAPHSWYQVQLMSTEGEPRYDFEALAELFEECSAAGIRAVQVVGWNDGGQDGLVPVHRPSPKLGGEAGLRRALDRAAQLEIKAVLYVKYQWVEKPGPAWDELERFACLDANGQPYPQPGPVYHTAYKRYGISTPWYVPLCFASPELRARFAAEVADMARWGAAGVLADESLYHGRALLCFAPGHPHEPGASTYLWDNEFVEEVRLAAAEHQPDFVVLGEGCYDMQFEHYDASYTRTASATHQPTSRQLRTGARIITALTGFDDRNMAAQCLLYGYTPSFEPYNFKGRPSDMPATVAAAAAVQRMQEWFLAWLWDGRLIDVDPNAVTAMGKAHHPVTVWAADGRSERIAVIANYDSEELSLRVRAGLLGINDPVLVPVDSPGAALRGGELLLPPRSVSLVIDRTLIQA